MIIDTMNFQVFIDEITRGLSGPYRPFYPLGKPPELFVRLCDKLKNVQWDKAAENAVKVGGQLVTKCVTPNCLFSSPFLLYLQESGQFTNVTMVVRRLLKPKKAKELIKWLE